MPVAVGLAILAVVLCAGLGALLATRPSPGGPPASWVEALRPEPRTAGIQRLLDRRAEAVRTRNREAFLADVDQTDPDLLRRQGVVFDNLVRMPLAELTYHVEPAVAYPEAVPERITDRFAAVVYAPGVTVRYRIEGVDARAVATPWVPILGYRDARWVIAGDASGKDLPYGADGQAWDAGPIAVVRSDRVVGVLSADDTGRAGYLLQLSESALDRVRAVRPGGWEGTVVITAVQDRWLFDTYFAGAPDRIANVAAIAVPYYDQVVDWHLDATFVTTRVVLNPRQLSAQPEELSHDFVHEFTHAAMGPVTLPSTPRWLVEGFAEYVAYRSEQVSDSALRRLLRDATPDAGLPDDTSFYTDSSHYVTSWLACRLIAERYGQRRLIALYESFQRQADQAANVSATLGVSLTELTSQWRGYVQTLKG